MSIEIAQKYGVGVTYKGEDGGLYFKDEAGNVTNLTQPDQLVKVSSNDTTAGYLEGKLVAGTNITLTTNSEGANETITIDAAGGGGGSLPLWSEITGASYHNLNQGVTDYPLIPKAWDDLYGNRPGVWVDTTQFYRDDINKVITAQATSALFNRWIGGYTNDSKLLIYEMGDSPVAQTTSDGASFSLVDLPTCGGKYQAISSKTGDLHILARNHEYWYSTDGYTWTKGAKHASSANWYSRLVPLGIINGRTIFRATSGAYGDTMTRKIIATSDHVNFTELLSLPINTQLIAHYTSNGELYLHSTGTSEFYHTSDGITMSTYYWPESNSHALDHLLDKLSSTYIFTYLGAVWTSTDLVTWTQQSVTFPNARNSGTGVTVTNGVAFVAQSSTSLTDCLFTSIDGINWTQRNISATYNTAFASEYHDGKYFFATKARVFTSSDLSTWTLEQTVAPQYTASTSGFSWCLGSHRNYMYKLGSKLFYTASNGSLYVYDSGSWTIVSTSTEPLALVTLSNSNSNYKHLRVR